MVCTPDKAHVCLEAGDKTEREPPVREVARLFPEHRLKIVPTRLQPVEVAVLRPHGPDRRRYACRQGGSCYRAQPLLRGVEKFAVVMIAQDLCDSAYEVVAHPPHRTSGPTDRTPDRMSRPGCPVPRR